MKSFISKFKKSHVIIFLIILFLIPFPTEMVPEWKIQIVDKNNKSLPEVKVRQITDNYTFWGCCDSSYDEKISDSNGYAVFPAKYLWASSFSRIVYPPIANIMLLAHGSAGAYSSVWIIDKNYLSKFTDSWSDGERLYFHYPEKLPKKLVTDRIKNKNSQDR